MPLLQPMAAVAGPADEAPLYHTNRLCSTEACSQLAGRNSEAYCAAIDNMADYAFG